jgi:DsbC/DsbD-like thiol-disulfide interchange protein
MTTNAPAVEAFMKDLGFKRVARHAFAKPGHYVSFSDAAFFYKACRAREAEAENKVIEIAHRKPCDCGSTEHFPTPVRSVQGNVTYYCQFSRVVLSAKATEGGESDEPKQ